MMASRALLEDRETVVSLSPCPVVPLRPAQVTPKPRARHPRSLKPLDHATPEFARGLADKARGGGSPYRDLSPRDAYDVAIRMIQLTAGRLYRYDSADLLSLAEHLRRAAEK